MGRSWDFFFVPKYTERTNKRLFVFSCEISLAILEHGLEGGQEWKQEDQFGGFCNHLEGR